MKKKIKINSNSELLFILVLLPRSIGKVIDAKFIYGHRYRQAEIWQSKSKCSILLLIIKFIIVLLPWSAKTEKLLRQSLFMDTGSDSGPYCT